MSGSGAALIVVDLQNGFISLPDELPVAGGHDVIAVINRLVPRFAVRIATQDWHPAGHGSFASNQPGRKPFDVGSLGGVPQVFWPDHCVQGTAGAEFHRDFDVRPIQTIFRKGSDPRVDSYSAFADNARMNPSGLDGFLRGKDVRELYIAGLALDYCVRFTALDARRLMPEMAVTVVLDACRPVAEATGEEAIEEMKLRGVRLIESRDLAL